MIYILLPTLLTAGLALWALDGFGGGSGGGDDEPTPDPQPNVDPETGRLVVKLTNGEDTHEGAATAEQVFSYQGNDNVFGGGGDDALNLGAGSDFGVGGEGDDRIFGNDDNDLINGGAGDDFVNGGAGNDLVVSNDQAAVVAQATGRTMEQLFGDLQLSTTVAEFNARGDVSDAGDDYIQGGAGNDILVDTAGKNLIEGGPDNDIIVTVDANGTDTPDVVYGGSGNDDITADDGDKVYGNIGRDTFRVSVMEATDKPVEIKDYELGETLQIQIDTANNQAPTLTYTINNGVVSVQSGTQVLANLHSKGDAFTAANLPAIQAAVQVSAV